jgi:hypothetical protein
MQLLEFVCAVVVNGQQPSGILVMPVDAAHLG